MSRIRLRSVRNIRDFAGVELKDGRIAASRRFIRSAHLHDLSDKDMKTLFEDLKVKTVIDLRTTEEAFEKPDRIPHGVRYINIPILDESKFGITHEEKRGQTESGKKAEVPDMEGLYRELVSCEFSINGIRKALQAIIEADPNGAVLWHCTEGKDRCGIISAMFLSLAGATEESVYRDYLLTRKTSVKRAMKYYWLVRIFEHDKEMAQAVKAAYSAERKYLDAAMETIKARCGTIEDFLKHEIGIDPETNELL